MPTWDELFSRGQCVAEHPEREVLRFVSVLERSFSERPLRIWDLCCGAGRHTCAVAGRGHRAYASDISEAGVSILRGRLSECGLIALTSVADMTVCPWPEVSFHGVVSWDSLHHNSVSDIRSSLAVVFERLVPGGYLLATLKSVNADSFGMGEELEPGTFVQNSGPEAGVPHHYFTEAEIRELFDVWELSVLAERVCDYRVRGERFLDVNPFDYTTWCLLARKPEG